MCMKEVLATWNGRTTRVRLMVPADLCRAALGEEISPGVSLCGYHEGRRWGVVRTYRPDGNRRSHGNAYTAYDLRDAVERGTYDGIRRTYCAGQYSF